MDLPLTQLLLCGLYIDLATLTAQLSWATPDLQREAPSLPNHKIQAHTTDM